MTPIPADNYYTNVNTREKTVTSFNIPASTNKGETRTGRRFCLIYEVKTGRNPFHDAPRDRELRLIKGCVLDSTTYTAAQVLLQVPRVENKGGKRCGVTWVINNAHVVSRIKPAVNENHVTGIWRGKVCHTKMDGRRWWASLLVARGRWDRDRPAVLGGCGRRIRREKRSLTATHVQYVLRTLHVWYARTRS